MGLVCVGARDRGVDGSWSNAAFAPTSLDNAARSRERAVRRSTRDSLPLGRLLSPPHQPSWIDTNDSHAVFTAAAQDILDSREKPVIIIIKLADHQEGQNPYYRAGASSSPHASSCHG